MNDKLIAKRTITLKQSKHLFETEVELRMTDRGKELSICGTIYKLPLRKIKDNSMIAGGQCLDHQEYMALYRKHPSMRRIYSLWKSHHLNSMHAGTEAQESAVHNWCDVLGHRFDYDEICQMLQENGLLVDNGYKYGTAWLYREIPENDMKDIESILDESNSIEVLDEMFKGEKC